MNPPTRTVWIATFVGLVFSIGLLTGIIVERKVLSGPGFRDSGPGFRDQGGRGPGFGRGSGVGSDFGPGRAGGGRRGGGPGGPGRGLFGAPPEVYVQELMREITLSDAQRTAILELLAAQESRLRTQQDEARRTFASEQQALHDRIAATLSPEQATAFRAWVERRTGPGRGR